VEEEISFPKLGSFFIPPDCLAIRGVSGNVNFVLLHPVMRYNGYIKRQLEEGPGMIYLSSIILIAICYTPVIYRINKRLNNIERQLEMISRQKQDENS
jgi:hypothetical protein